MSHTEQAFIIWVCLSLLSVISFVLIVFVRYFMQMAKDVGEIKTALQVHTVKHDNLEKRVDHLEKISEA